MTIEIWKWIHVSCACLSISGFFLRGMWMFSGSVLFQHRLTKILPHLVDSLLLVSALVMLFQWRLNPLEHAWLLTKIMALLVYIMLGMVAFRFGRSQGERVLAWVSALLVTAYIVQTAFTKNPWIF